MRRKLSPACNNYIRIDAHSSLSQTHSAGISAISSQLDGDKSAALQRGRRSQSIHNNNRRGTRARALTLITSHAGQPTMVNLATSAPASWRRINTARRHHPRRRAEPLVPSVRRRVFDARRQRKWSDAIERTVPRGHLQ